MPPPPHLTKRTSLAKENAGTTQYPDGQAGWHATSAEHGCGQGCAHLVPIHRLDHYLVRIGERAAARDRVG